MYTEPHIQLSLTFSPPYTTGYMYTYTEDKKNKDTKTNPKTPKPSKPSQTTIFALGSLV